MNDNNANTMNAPKPEMVCDLLADLEQRVEQIKQWQTDQDRFVEQLDARAEQLDGQQQIIEQLSLESSQQREALDSERARCQTEAAELHNGGQQIQKQREGLEQRRAAFESECDGRRQSLDDRANELEMAQNAIESHRHEIERQHAALNEARRQTDQQRQGLEQERARLQQDQKVLRDQIDSFNQQRGELTKQQQWIDAELPRLEQQSTRTSRRRQRLQKSLVFLRQGRRNLRQQQRAARLTHRRVQGVLKQRQMLLEVEQLLAESEQRMVRRWASMRAGTVAAVSVASLVLLAAFSYIVGSRATVPVWQATVVLAYERNEASPQTRGDQWVSHERALLLGDSILNETISQLAQRGTSLFDGTETLAAELDGALSVQADGPDRLKLTYQKRLPADRSDQVTDVVDALGRARIGYELAQQQASDIRQSPVRIGVPAARAAEPIEDRRLIASATLFGISSASALLLALGLRWCLLVLNRPTQSLEEMAQLQVLKNVDQWPDDLKITAAEAEEEEPQMHKDKVTSHE